MTSKKPAKFVILAVLDGWGIARAGPGNAISLAKTVNMDRLWASYPHTQLEASGQAVGLPRGEDGNTETGHLNIGAGRIVYQELERINVSIADGSFFENEVLIEAINHAKKNKSNLHLMGLVGAGGVHSNIEHLFALIQLAKRHNFSNVFLHLFSDGRDSPPTTAQDYIKQLREVIKKEGLGQIASIMGRYWAMDRDRRWDRTGRAYFALTKGKGYLVKSVEEAIEKSYSRGQTDEFIQPSLISNSQGKPVALVKDDDSVIFFNFRIDRPRQLTAGFIVKGLNKKEVKLEFDPYLERYEKTHLPSKVSGLQKPFDRGKSLRNLFFATMTKYSNSLVEAGAKVAFPPEQIETPLGASLSVAGISQLRITESEKERFVTFYFNGLREKPYATEKWIIIPSPKVPTYDQIPEMSSKQLTDTLLAQLKKDGSRFVLVNYPNPDMVGHTGNIGAAVQAIEAVDECVGRITSFVLAYEEGILLITADHGNVEEMINARTGQVDTEHSSNPVPFIAVSRRFLGKPQTLQSGILADLAPTVISLFGLKVPAVMSGRNLLKGVW